jgi:hypothetical protein
MMRHVPKDQPSKFSTEEAEELAAFICEFELSDWPRLVEPGTRYLIERWVAPIQAQRLCQAMCKDRPFFSRALVKEVSLSILKRAGIAAFVLSPFSKNRIEGIDPEFVHTMYLVELGLARFSSDRNWETYAGWTVTLLRTMPSVDKALEVCELEAIAKLGLPVEQIPAQVVDELVLATKIGFSMGIAEGLALAAKRIQRNDFDAVNETLLDHFLETASLLPCIGELEFAVDLLRTLLIHMASLSNQEVRDSALERLAELENAKPARLKISR